MATRPKNRTKPRPRNGNREVTQRAKKTTTSVNEARGPAAVARAVCGIHSRGYMRSTSRDPISNARRSMAMWLIHDPALQHLELSSRDIAAAMGVSTGLPSRVRLRLVDHAKLREDSPAWKLREHFRVQLDKLDNVDAERVQKYPLVLLRRAHLDAMMQRESEGVY